MKAAGVTFVCRYLSYDTTGKTATPGEVATLRAAGMALVFVWETTASRALAGMGAGQADATAALSQARGLGLPDDRPIFFAVDFDAVPTEQPKINDYFSGVASVIGLNRTGMYGGYGPVSRAFDAGKIRYGWQTLAWSNGKWDGRAGIQQYAIEQRMSAQDVDFNRSVLDDYGQWTVGDSVAFTATDKEWMLTVLVPALAKATWLTDNIIKAADGGTGNTHWTAAFHVESLGKFVRSISAALAGLDPSVDEAQIIAGILSGLGPALDPERLADAIATHMGSDMANATLDALRTRLEG
jgi:hypothetical protein